MGTYIYISIRSCGKSCQRCLKKKRLTLFLGGVALLSKAKKKKKRHHTRDQERPDLFRDVLISSVCTRIMTDHKSDHRAASCTKRNRPLLEANQPTTHSAQAEENRTRTTPHRLGKGN